MFKVVQTVNAAGECELCTVPESWEKNGILHWPPGRNGFTLRKNANILPDLTNWTSETCVVKKHNITGFKEALNYEKNLAEYLGTEDELSSVENLAKQKKHPCRNIELVNYDSHFQTNIDVNQLHQPESEINVLNEDPCETVNVINYVPIGSNLEIEEKLNGILERCIILEHNQQQTDEKITTFIAGINLQFDKLITTLSKYHSKDTSMNPATNIQCNDDEMQFTSILPIRSGKEMEDFEMNLKDKEFLSKFINYMSRFGGVNGNNSYNKIIYLVFDTIVDKRFLTECSYTGSSKSTNEKITFKSFKLFIEIFYKIINLADSRYTIEENFKFIKRILKNSGRRYQLSIIEKSKSSNSTNLQNDPEEIVYQESLNSAENGNDVECNLYN